MQRVRRVVEEEGYQNKWGATDITAVIPSTEKHKKSWGIVGYRLPIVVIVRKKEMLDELSILHFEGGRMELED